MYKIGICDDDKMLCAQLEEQLFLLEQEFGTKFEVEVWYSAESIQADILKGQQMDLLFLDIELVQKDGIELGLFLRNEMEDLQTHIVYISAKQNYAMKLFKIQPLDFLIKPVTAEQLKEVIGRSMRQKMQGAHYFEYQQGGSCLRVSLNDILYFMSMNRKVAIATKNGREEFYGKLKEIAEQLPEDFIRIHQSYIVNHNFVREYSYESIRLVNGEELSVSAPYRKEVRNKIKSLNNL